MNADAFARWLVAMKEERRARSAAECAWLLGLTPKAVSQMKRRGCDQRTAIACSGLLQGLKPYA